jgi:prophage tail gpP-like protein
MSAIFLPRIVMGPHLIGHSEPAWPLFSATERFIHNTANVTAKVNTDTIQKVSSKRRRLRKFSSAAKRVVATQPDSRSAEGRTLGPREEGSRCRIERIEILPKSAGRGIAHAALRRSGTSRQLSGWRTTEAGPPRAGIANEERQRIYKVPKGEVWDNTLGRATS